MRNSEYTCDRCGAQVSTEDAYTLRLSRKLCRRADGSMKEPRSKVHASYDLCEGCAAQVEASLPSLLAIHRRAG